MGNSTSVESDILNVEDIPEGLKFRIRQSRVLKSAIQTPTVLSKRKIRNPDVAINRLHSVWEKEEHFLYKMINGKLAINASRLASSNFSHLHGILCLLQAPFIEDICDVFSPLELDHGKQRQRLTVDIIGYSGRLWVNVIARKGKQMFWNRNCSESKHGMKDRVKWLLEASAKAPSQPFVIFCIPEGTSEIVTDKLISKHGAFPIAIDAPFSVPGAADAFAEYRPSFYMVVANSNPYKPYLTPSNIHHILTNTTEYINLDTSTLLALSSDLTHGKVYEFLSYVESGRKDVNVSNFIVKQIYEEIETPLLPLLGFLISHNNLITTRAAHTHFYDILMKIGSKEEKERGNNLLARVRIFEEVDWAEELGYSFYAEPTLHAFNRLQSIPTSNTLKSFPLEVFGRADIIPGMITATSNQSFVRAVREHGVYLRTFLHPPRSLMTNKFDFL